MRGRLTKLSRSYPTATERAAASVATAVLHDAITETPTVPVRTGNLRGSGTFEVYGGTHWRRCKLQVGFNANYAARVHQVPMNVREPSAGNYFLSAKLKRHGREYMTAWVRDVSRAVGTL